MVALAGVSDYDRFTPRELFWMVRAKRSEMWNPFAALLAAIHNIFAKKPLSPKEFHPMYVNKFVRRSSKFVDSLEKGDIHARKR